MQRRYIVSGRVQGVFYRASTQKQAQQLGLKGWVRNLSSGQVEAIAQGDEAALTIFEKWLWQGPVAAKVTHVEVYEECVDDCMDFSIRKDGE